MISAAEIAAIENRARSKINDHLSPSVRAVAADVIRLIGEIRSRRMATPQCIAWIWPLGDYHQCKNRARSGMRTCRFHEGWELGE